MPIYEFKCPKGHYFEVFQRMTDDPPEVCTECGRAPLQRVLHPVAVHYKGSGFYSTDYGKSGGRKGSASAEGSSGSSDGGGSSGGSSAGSSDGGSSSAGSSAGDFSSSAKSDSKKKPSDS